MLWMSGNWALPWRTMSCVDHYMWPHFCLAKFCVFHDIGVFFFYGCMSLGLLCFELLASGPWGFRNVPRFYGECCFYVQRSPWPLWGERIYFCQWSPKKFGKHSFPLSTLKGNRSMSRLWERWTQYCQMEGNAYKSELWGGQASALLLGKPAGTQGHCLLASDIRSWVLWEGSSRACCRRWDWPCCSFGSLVETYAYSGKNGCKIDFIILWKVRF